MSEKEPEKKPKQLKLGHNIYTSQIDPGKGIPDFMEIEPLPKDEFSDHPEKPKPTKKARLIRLSDNNKGLFSTISPKGRWRDSDGCEMTQGILNYGKIAEDPNYGKK